MAASLWGMRSVDDLDFSLYFPYPFVPLISLNFLLVSKSLVLYWRQLVRLSFGDCHCLLFDTPSLSNCLLTQHYLGTWMSDDW